MKERQPSICPTCERKFKEIKDYPKIYVVSVSVIKPDDFPTEIPNFWRENLLEAPKKGRNQELVPTEVLEFFRSNPNEYKLVHSDSFIYHRPHNQTQEYRRQKEAHPEMYDGSIVRMGEDNYKREFNYAPMIRILLEQNVPFKEYLESLQQTVGQEIRKRKIFPNWEPNYISGFEIPVSSGLILNFEKGKRNKYGYQVDKIGIWGEGPNMGSIGGPTITKLLSIGSLEYEGRINKI